MKKPKHQHDLIEFVFKSGEKMSRCKTCDFGEGHEPSNLYTKRRGSIVKSEPESEEIVESEVEPRGTGRID
jgi:hypothetical protein